jgi:hypothetical protein
VTGAPLLCCCVTAAPFQQPACNTCTARTHTSHKPASSYVSKASIAPGPACTSPPSDPVCQQVNAGRLLLTAPRCGPPALPLDASADACEMPWEDALGPMHCSQVRALGRLAGSVSHHAVSSACSQEMTPSCDPSPGSSACLAPARPFLLRAAHTCLGTPHPLRLPLL